MGYFFAIFDRLRRHLDLPFKLTQEGFASEDYPQLDALREALVNMLMHSDYFSAACPRVRVFDDRIEFFNPGALPKPLKKLMEEDISLPRNPIIAKFFRVVKLAENAGYGFDKMINGWKEYTGSEPEFDQGQDYTKAIFYFKKKGEVRDKFGISSGKVGTKWGISGEKLGKSERLILEAVSDNAEITISEISERIGIGTTAIENNIKKLKEKGLLERKGGRKEGQWKVNL